MSYSVSLLAFARFSAALEPQKLAHARDIVRDSRKDGGRSYWVRPIAAYRQWLSLGCPDPETFLAPYRAEWSHGSDRDKYTALRLMVQGDLLSGAEVLPGKRTAFLASEIRVTAAPDLVVRHRGALLVIKLFLAKKESSGPYGEVMADILREANASLFDTGARFLVVDVSKGVLYHPSRDRLLAKARLQSQAAFLRVLWDEIEEEKAA